MNKRLKKKLQNKYIESQFVSPDSGILSYKDIKILNRFFVIVTSDCRKKKLINKCG